MAYRVEFESFINEEVAFSSFTEEGGKNVTFYSYEAALKFLLEENPLLYVDTKLSYEVVFYYYLIENIVCY